jgi:hypothetical protein
MHPAMTVSKTLSILLLATSLGFVGCKKKEDASSAAPGSAATSSAAATKPAEPAAAAPAPAAPAVPATPPPAAATPAGAITSDDQYIATVTAGLDKVITLFKGAGTNCDKLADDLVKFAQDNGPQIKAYREYEKAHPEAQAKFNAAAQSKVTDFQASAGPAIDACKDNKKLADAMAKLGSE